MTLPIMVAVVISLVWRQFASVSEALRVLKTEGLLWADPLQVTQQALSERLRTLPADLFWQVLQDVLPVMQSRWQERTRPLPAEITWVLTQYERVWAVDDSTLDGAPRKGIFQGLLSQVSGNNQAA